MGCKPVVQLFGDRSRCVAQLTARTEDDLRTAFSEQERRGLAYSTARARDRNDLVFDSRHDGFLSGCDIGGRLGLHRLSNLFGKDTSIVLGVECLGIRKICEIVQECCPASPTPRSALLTGAIADHIGSGSSLGSSVQACIQRMGRHHTEPLARDASVQVGEDVDLAPRSFTSGFSGRSA